ncbi:hypothetical protein DHW03_06200 [Pedobacter yonginense]|uniref:Uncharacterized protein n=1 Tax=Pedobacter yonginense TaxID=651869 RepID=A0A317EW23_9SPHI|nr:hypothetical protein [Pedobacter yonginense]PWS29406.1 hypothetical protein DHW03_06200 [Pedobacter yonginense]
MDIKDIEKTYEQMSDSELIRITTTSAQGLRPEVFGIIENEIKKRNLDLNILNGALAQNMEYSIEEIEHYSQFLRNLPCPICNNETEKLNGTSSHKVKSFIFVTVSETEPTIACPNCLDKTNNSAIISTALFGWWGIPWGIFKTPIYIYRNFRDKKENRIDSSNKTLLSFTLSNIGKIEAYKDDKGKLQEIIELKKS